MNIIIPTIGTRGDVQPYIALGLMQAGQQMTLASHPVMRMLVECYGVTCAPMGPDIHIGYETALIRRRSPNWLVGFLRVMKFSFTTPVLFRMTGFWHVQVGWSITGGSVLLQPVFRPGFPCW